MDLVEEAGMDLAQEKDMRDRGAEFSPITSNFAHMALESVAAGLIVIDLSGCIRYMNLAASQLLGRTLEQSRGLPWRECLRLIDENTRKEVPDLVSGCLATGRPIELGVYALLVDARGAEIPVEGNVAPFCWLDDDVFGTVMMLRDVTTSRKHLRQRSTPAEASVSVADMASA
jgi:PAS domain S-box-containing protein